jgi:multidrug efflux pump subunit AcrA (membrane-fusion protein)
MKNTFVLPLIFAALAGTAHSESLTLSLVEVTDWKAVYSRIEARDRVPARARIGGTLVEVLVVEGDQVAEGQVLARIVDEKLGLQLSAINAQKTAVAAQLANARAEVTRGEDLLAQGVTTVQRQDALRTQADVLSGQLSALDAQMDVIRQSQAEGQVLAPAAGRVLDVPVSKGAVVMPGEAIATLAVGGNFLRLSVPERLATTLREGDTIQIENGDAGAVGRLGRIYPLIENGRVVADVEVDGLSGPFRRCARSGAPARWQPRGDCCAAKRHHHAKWFGFHRLGNGGWRDAAGRGSRWALCGRWGGAGGDPVRSAARRPHLDRRRAERGQR